MREYVLLRSAAMTLRASVGLQAKAKLSESDVSFVRKVFEPRIVGGKPATSMENPFQVALLKKSTPNNFNAQFCGGTLIKANVIVTAAHCSDFVTASDVQVLTGARELNGSGTRRNVTSITIHPKWNAQTFDYDVAVWKLDSDAAGIPIARLTASDPAVGTSLLATGWGALSQGGGFPIALHAVPVPVADRSDCNDGDSYKGAITDRMICAGYSAGGKDTCQGDSGGPLSSGSGSSELIGITSWGNGCAQPNFYGVYGRISNAELHSFIATNM